ncbi:hypothetical protein MPLA_660005 [Mesorhizobium sp. ORS 3359]|nr:hypothetical protein MPLA_660005 [Mesorhizobium sp. ORS 3359]
MTVRTGRPAPFGVFARPDRRRLRAKITSALKLRENPIVNFMNLKERSIGQTDPGYVTAQPWPINPGIDGMDVCAKSGESAARQSRGMMP